MNIIKFFSSSTVLVQLVITNSLVQYKQKGNVPSYENHFWRQIKDRKAFCRDTYICCSAPYFGLKLTEINRCTRCTRGEANLTAATQISASHVLNPFSFFIDFALSICQLQMYFLTLPFFVFF